MVGIAEGTEVTPPKSSATLGFWAETRSYESPIADTNALPQVWSKEGREYLPTYVVRYLALTRHSHTTLVVWKELRRLHHILSLHFPPLPLRSLGAPLTQSRAVARGE